MTFNYSVDHPLGDGAKKVKLCKVVRLYLLLKIGEYFKDPELYEEKLKDNKLNKFKVLMVELKVS